MCCLFGMIDCKNALTGREKSRMLMALGAECEERGTDAAGVAYNSGGKLRIYKRPLPAHALGLRIPNDARVIMGHTRMTTQGSEKRNRNNHPFRGRAGHQTFALAHNGVIYNDRALRYSRKLPGTNIETDSYAAVQLIERQGGLSFDSLKYMAEQVEGSFSFTVLGSDDSLYFVKGDNPICLCRFPEEGVYLYASTAAILEKALAKLGMSAVGREQIPLECGDILQIAPNGDCAWGNFDASQFYFRTCYPYGWDTPRKGRASDDIYIQSLRSMASTFGYRPECIEGLLQDGFTLDEVEDMLYCGEL